MVIACAHSETKPRRGPERRAKLSSSLEEKPEAGYSPSQGWRKSDTWLCGGEEQGI